MKKIILIFILLYSVTASHAQKFQLSGKVVEENSHPVEFAEILLLQKNAIIQYQLTGDSGRFVCNAAQGNYSLLIRLLGDTLYTKDLEIAGDIDLGNIMVRESKLLQEVTVVGKKKLMERKTDRTIFNAADLSSTDGGDAMEVLRITPGVLVSNNTISIAGKSAVSVMINDRPVKLSGDELVNFLKSLKADDIQNIEVITTPPAKYEAEGNGGLINIVMKKTPVDTWNGSVYGNYRQAEYARGMLGGSFNYNKKALSFYADVSYGDGKSELKHDDSIFYPDLKWEIKDDFINRTKLFDARTGFDLNINNHWSLGAQYIGSLYNGKRNINNIAGLFDRADNGDAGGINTKTNGKWNEDTHSGNIHSVVLLDSSGRKINFDFDVLSYNSNSNAIYKSNTEGSGDPQVPNGFASENNILDRKITNYAVQIDVEHPVKKISLNYGTKLSFTHTNNDIQVYDLGSGVPVNDLNQTNKFLYDENIQAVYASGNAQSGKWTVQVGLRAENTQFKGHSVTMDTVFKKSYLEFFPTAHLTYQYNEKSGFYAEYGRRINRPNFDQLNPFRFYTSPYFYYAGNPELRPFYTHNLSSGYTYNDQFQVELSYSKEKNSFGGGVNIIDADGYTQHTTRLNYLDDYTVGTTVVYMFNKLSWWTGQNSGSLFYQHFDSNIYPLTPKSSKGYLTYFQTTNTFYFNKNQTLSAGFDLTVIPGNNAMQLIHMYTQTNLNAFVKMTFLDKTLSVTLTGNNLSNGHSLKWRGESNGNLQYSTVYDDPFFLRLSVSYNFGSKKVNVQQHQNSNEDEKNRLQLSL
ncbi:MAG: TonB-dependent receptor [Candidatus Azobacteroides sp.]|nr:TonB-dependent receptor [Candidatus Azobacteroides sp.]